MPNVEDDIIVHVGAHPTTGLEVYRKYRHPELDRENKITRFFYDEYYIVNDEKVEIKTKKHYIVRNVLAGEDPNDTGTPLESDFLGYDNSRNFNIGALPDPTPASYLEILLIVPKLTAVPIDAESGYVITS